VKLTILMYHKVAEIPPGARHVGNYVTPTQFTAQMDALLDWGYRTISFEQWLSYRDSGADLPPKPLILTFDDGYRCFDDTAWPALRARAMAATVFLVAGQIGGTNAWDADERRERLLDADRVRALRAEGVDFGSHGYAHLALAKVPPDVALDDMSRSRVALEQLVGAPVTTLSYPFSNQNRLVRQLARRAGYRACVRGKGRMNVRRTDVYGLRRIKVDYRATIDDLKRTLFTARWLRLD
jgi:peptidoglycan/xylan/chitin deacetylase (PgdA/CDA1 family)